MKLHIYAPQAHSSWLVAFIFMIKPVMCSMGPILTSPLTVLAIFLHLITTVSGYFLMVSLLNFSYDLKLFPCLLTQLHLSPCTLFIWLLQMNHLCVCIAQANCSNSAFHSTSSHLLRHQCSNSSYPPFLCSIYPSVLVFTIYKHTTRKISSRDQGQE